LIKSVAILVPELFVMQVFPKDPDLKGTGALKSNHSLRERGSMTFFFTSLFAF